MDEVILSRIRHEAYEQGYQDGKVDGYNLAGTRISLKLTDFPTADVGTKSNELNRLENAIHGKSPEEIYEFIDWLFFRYAVQFTDSRHAIINWLKGE